MLRRIGCISVLTLGALALIAAIVISWMSRTAPSWYAPPDPRSAAIAAIADDFEYDVFEQAQRHRPENDASWSATITEQQLNAWLSNRLPMWIAHEPGLEWPASLGTPQVQIEPNGISIALPVGEDAPRTVIARFLPTLEQGKLRLRVNRVAVGRISMPGEPLSNLINAIEDLSPQTLNDPNLQQAISLLSGQQTIDPQLQLEDGRRVHLTALQLSFDKLTLRAATKPGHEQSSDQ